MRGPSSSHTAGAYHIGTLARSLLGEEPLSARFTFDPSGSYGRVYREQGADLAFAAALLGWPITDDRFPDALDHAAGAGIEIEFTLEDIPGAEHPNSVEIHLTAQGGGELTVSAASTGGGAVEITRVDAWPVLINGRFHNLLVEVESGTEESAIPLLSPDEEILELERIAGTDRTLLHCRGHTGLDPESKRKLEDLPGVQKCRESGPVFFVQRGISLFSSASEMLAMVEGRGITLGVIALEYESQLLGLGESEVLAELRRRFEIMAASVARGLEPDLESMQLLEPSAGLIMEAEAREGVAVGGMHTRAAARAMSVMHVNASGGVVCAAPTAGSAGVLPAVLTTLRDEMEIPEEVILRALLAAGAVGLFTAERATFAAEVAGCQVEIGAAGAMAAAAVVEAAGGNVRQALDAAAIAYQNSMGSVCDLVQGMVEIPCHTRNATAASSAFVCADLIMGGYSNPIPLDETIDAVYSVGRMLPAELRCTALGGLADTPSAKGIKRLR